MPGFIEYQLDDAERQRHTVQQAALFQQTHAHGAGLCVRQPDLCTQAAVVAQAALASLKGAAVRHGVDPIVADVYDLAAAHRNSLADVQEQIFRQHRQNAVQRRIQRSFLAVHAVNDCFTVAAVKIQNVFRTKVIFLKPFMQIVHRRAPLSIDVLSIAHYRAEYKILMAFASNFIGLFC